MSDGQILSALDLFLSLVADAFDSILLFGLPLIAIFLLVTRRESLVAKVEGFGGFLSRRGFGNVAYSIKVSVTVRVLLGVALGTRAALNLFFSTGALSFEGMVFVLELIASFFLMVGLFAQWTIIFFVLVDLPVLVPASGWSSVSNNVATMVLIGIFLLQSGRSFSLDKILEARLSGSRFRSWLLYSWELSESGVALAKFTALLSYGFLSLYSVSMHLADSAWLDGTAGPLLLTNNFMSPFAEELQSLAEGSPFIVHLMRISMWVQILWFVSLTWLPIFSRVGRLFTIAWGWVFFIASAALLSLGFTATFELLLWFLIFGLFRVDTSLSRDSGFEATISPRSRLSQNTSSGPVAKLQVSGFLTLLLFAGPLYLLTVATPFAPHGLLPDNLGSRTASLWGLVHINVFNEEDLRMRENIFVIRDVSSQVTLPIFEEDGSRGYVLSSPRNYFGKAMPIIRGEIYQSGCGIDRNSELLRSLAKDYYRSIDAVAPALVQVAHWKQPSPPTDDLLEGRYIETSKVLVCEGEVTL